MFQGFYMAASGMLSQNRNLNVISNNMSNVSTPGFRGDRYIATTFQEEIMSRIGNLDKSTYSPLGTTSKIVAPDETVTDYSVQYYAPTRNSLDFALSGEGFFCIQSEEYGTVYTRNGSFTLDDQGYLYLPTIGRVIGENGPIYLGRNDIVVNPSGEIYTEDGNTRLGRIQVVDFNDYQAQLTKTTGNVFVAENGGAFETDTEVVNYGLEYSNVDVAEEMVEMMSAQRALQSSSKVLSMYDTLMGKMVSRLGPV